MSQRISEPGGSRICTVITGICSVSLCLPQPLLPPQRYALLPDNKTTDDRKKTAEMTKTGIGSTTVTTRTITIGTTAKTMPIADISRSATETTDPLLKQNRGIKGRIGTGATVIQIVITTTASSNILNQN